MILTGDYHTHTPYSHGKNTVLENTIAAKKLGLKEIAITDHGFNHLLFGLKRSRLGDLRAEIEEAKRLTGLNVLMGMESNLISLDGQTDMKESDYTSIKEKVVSLENGLQAIGLAQVVSVRL